jgi:hypothetical protein
VSNERKKRKLPKPPAGDFARGDLLWMPERLRPEAGFSVTVPFKPPLLNELNILRAVDAHRRGHGGYNDYKAQWERAIRHCWVTQAWSLDLQPPCVTGSYNVRYLYLCADKRGDPSNMHAAFEKFFLDALKSQYVGKGKTRKLVAAGALPGDSAAHHAGSSYAAEYGEKWGIVVSVTSAAEVLAILSA